MPISWCAVNSKSKTSLYGIFHNWCPILQWFSLMSFPSPSWFLCLVILNRSLLQCLSSLPLNPLLTFCVRNSLCQKYFYGFLTTARQTTSCDWFESGPYCFHLVPSVPLLKELVNNLPPALSHHVSFDLRELYFSHLLSQSCHPFSRLKRPCCSSDPSYSSSWRGMKDGMNSDAGEPWC